MNAGPFQLGFAIKWPARGCHHRGPVESAKCTCAVPGCEAPVTWTSTVVADGPSDACILHAVESEILVLAGFVQRRVDAPDGDLAEAHQAAKTLAERIVMLAAMRDVLTRAAEPRTT